MSSGAHAGRVLVVEDDMMIAMLLEDTLAEFGFAVVGPFARLSDAITSAQREDLDAAILDVNLDGRPVYPVAEALAARGIPFLFATGYGQAALPEPWCDRPTLAKPFYRRDVGNAVTALLVSETG